LSSEEPWDRDLIIRCIWTCGLCSAVCCDRAISYMPDSVKVDRSACTRCLVCVEVCPAGILGEKAFA
jgi:ferredoxin